MTDLNYKLKGLDEIDGLPARKPIEPQWKVKVAPEGEEMAHLGIGGVTHQQPGWSELDDIMRTIAGFEVAHDTTKNLTRMHPADALRVMTVFRLLGADSRLTVHLPQKYWDIVDANPGNADQQVRLAEKLRQDEIANGTVRSVRR